MPSLPLPLLQMFFDSNDVAFTPQPNRNTTHFLQWRNGYLPGCDVPLERNPAHANLWGRLLRGVHFHSDIDLYQVNARIARTFVSYVGTHSCHTRPVESLCPVLCPPSN